MDEQTMQPLRAQLESDRDGIAAQLRDLGADVEGDRVDLDVEGGFADSAAATTERSEMLSLVEQLSGTYKDTLDALRKMDEGTYGLCERCGNPIAPERLEALPSARLCVRCKQEARTG